MKLAVYEVAGDRIAGIGTVTEHDATIRCTVLFRPSGGPANQRLSPADGEPYLRAVHKEISRGARCWSELVER